MTTDEQRQDTRPKSARQAESDHPADRAIELPRPTRDQEEYLKEIQRESANYDPKTVVGGPRRTQI